MCMKNGIIILLIFFLSIFYYRYDKCGVVNDLWWVTFSLLLLYSKQKSSIAIWSGKNIWERIRKGSICLFIQPHLEPFCFITSTWFIIKLRQYLLITPMTIKSIIFMLILKKINWLYIFIEKGCIYLQWNWKYD